MGRYSGAALLRASASGSYEEAERYVRSQGHGRGTDEHLIVGGRQSTREASEAVAQAKVAGSTTRAARDAFLDWRDPQRGATRRRGGAGLSLLERGVGPAPVREPRQLRSPRA